jgi:TetR/AcrR family transcriptional regulator
MPTAQIARAPEEAARRRGEATAERILDVAEALFAEHGYAGASLRDVADGVGIRTPSLYNHFAGKEALYAAVLERGLAPIVELLSVPQIQAGSSDPSRIAAEVMRLLTRHPNVPRLVLHETASGGQRLTPMLRNWIAPAFERAHEMAASSPAVGSWGPDRIPLLVLAMYHVVVGYFTMAPLYRELRGVDLLTPDALVAQTAFLRELVSRLLPLGAADEEETPWT